MTELPVTQVDAFTDRPFAGNPAAVCVLDGPLADPMMQDIAREMNLSETAFLVPRDDGYDLRWFTPSAEVDLCGHATLAAAHVLWESGALPAEAEARFHTRSGLLTAARRNGRIEMDFPAEPASPDTPPPALAEAVGAALRFTGRNRMDWLLEVADEGTVRALAPDMGRLAGIDTRAVIVTAASETPGVDFVSRVFAPAVGVPEDPVTGSAHCALGPFWAGRLGRSELVGYQASARGGTVRVRVRAPRVCLGGSAVTVLTGRLRVLA